jgi:hypothetical protein
MAMCMGQKAAMEKAAMNTAGNVVVSINIFKR